MAEASGMFAERGKVFLTQVGQYGEMPGGRE
jgi:hypothetical protein